MKFHRAYDGGSKFFEYLSEYLVKEGHDVTIITTPPKKGDFKERFYKGVRYSFISPYYSRSHFIKLNVPFKMIFSYNLLKYLKNRKYDLIHSSEAFSFFYLMKKKRKPVITQAFGLEPFYGPESLAQKGLKKLYVKLFLQYPWLFCLKKSDLMGLEGGFQISLLENIGIRNKKMVSIPNGIYLEGIKKYKKSFKNKRQKHNIGKNDFLIINVNQISPDKRVEDVIEAFFLLKKEIRNSKLIIIGKGVLEEEIHKLIAKLNLKKDIIHLKNLPEKDLYDYYLTSNIFVNASIQEDFIMSIQEAMACGLPIVSSNQPFLVKNGVNGFVVGPKNPERIKEGILKIYKGEKKNMKRMGRNSRKMGEKYDYNNITKLAIREYKKLLKKRI